MQQGKWDSSTEVTSLPGSSPPRSPSTHLSTARGGKQSRPGSTKPNNASFSYYVQSPSQHDGDSTYNYRSSQSSPTASPGRSLTDTRRSGKHAAHGKVGPGHGVSTTCSVIDEENDDIYRSQRPYQHPTSRLSARVRLFLIIFVCCGALFGLLILLLWLSTRPTAPQVSVKNVVFQNMYIGQGIDASGVPTSVLTLNCTVQIEFNNTSKHLKAHLQPLRIELLYSKRSITASKVRHYSQSKNTRKTIPIQMQASKVPLYGASYTLPTSEESTKQGFDLPLQLSTSICSRYYIVWKIVTSQFCTHTTCKVIANTKTLVLVAPINKDSCSLDPYLPS